MNSKQKHFIIKKDLTSPIQTLRYLGQFIDKYDYGLDLGKKNIIHCNNSIRMNGLMFSKYVRPKDRNRYTLKSRHIYEHMAGKKTYYFTSSPFSRYKLCVPDIDNKTDDPTRINSYLNFFLSYFPDIFYDRGSSGKSLHPYLKLDMLPLYDFYFMDSNDHRSYPKYANELFNNAGYIIKLYGHHIIAPEHSFVDKETGELRTIYDIELDAIKGSYPDYKYFWNKKTGKYIITGVINHGVLVKLPRLITEEDYKWFYSSSVYSILDFISFVVYIGSSLLLSSCLHGEEKNRVEQSLSEFETVLKAHSVFPSQEGKDSVAVNLSCTGETRHNNSNYCLGKSRFQAKNNDFDKSKEYDQNANIRRIAIIQRLCREYYSGHEILPDNDYLERKYREHPASTGEADTADIKEIYEVCEYVKKEFIPEYAGNKVKYERLMFVPYIKKIFKKSEYKEILKDSSAKKCMPKNVILDLYAGYAYTCLSGNKNLTLSSYSGFKTFSQKYNIKLDDNMCLACRLLFEYYGWLEKIDADYEQPSYDHINGKIVKQEGKAMAFTLTHKFPFYTEFKKAVGQKNIDKVRTKGMVSIEDWDSKGQSA